MDSSSELFQGWEKFAWREPTDNWWWSRAAWARVAGALETFPPVVSDQAHGVRGAWSPQSSRERRLRKVSSVQCPEERAMHTIIILWQFHIAHGSQSKQKTWESSIHRTKRLHLYPSYIMTSPIVEGACETLILSEIQCPSHQDYNCYGIGVI